MGHSPTFPIRVPSTIQVGRFMKTAILPLHLIAVTAIALFLGDGKQTAVDAFLAIGTVSLAVVARFFGTKRRDLPGGFMWMWTAFLLYSVIRACLSDDVGFSAYAVTRYVDAFIIYYVFACYGDAAIQRLTNILLTGFCAVALVASIAITRFGLPMPWLPSMNLLDTVYGHNHVVDLLLLGFPIATVLWTKTKRRGYFIAAAFLFAGTALSLARLATAFEALFVIGLTAVTAFRQKRRRIVPFAAALAAVVIAGSQILLFQIPSLKPLAKATHVDKQALGSDVRAEYWKQALHAISVRPFFGSGPGTFELLSAKYQEKEFTVSWFAHNVLMEHMAENGIVGFLLFVGVLGTVGYGAWRGLSFPSSETDHTRISAAAAAASVVFLYAQFDYTLSYAVIWLLWWMLLGLTNHARFPHAPLPRKRPVLYLAGLAWVTLFYVVFMFVELYRPTAGPGRYVDVMTEQGAVADIRWSANVVPAVSRLDDWITTLHRSNPQVEYALGNGDVDRGDYPSAAAHYRAAMYGDPLNNEFFATYFELLSETADPVTVGRQLRAYSYRRFGPSHRGALDRIDFGAAPLLSAYETVFGRKHEYLMQGRHDLSAIYYYLGSDTLTSDPELTQDLWTVARDTYPDLGAYHVELASLMRHLFHDRPSENAVLAGCYAVPAAADECREYAGTRQNFPGGLMARIRIIGYGDR
jgi:O-antigen ligase